MKKLLFISLAFCIALGITLGCVLLKNEGPLFEQALLDFSEKNYLSSEEILASIENEKETFFPKACLALAQGEYPLSTTYFQKALLTFQKEGTLQEIYLGNSINAYFLNQPKEMEYFLGKAEKLHPPAGESPALSLVRGLYYYVHKEFSYAEEYFTSYLTSYLDQKSEGLSWFHEALEKCFYKAAVEMRLAYALTEQRKIAEARDILENLVQSPVLASREKAVATLFLGMTYLQEGMHLPLLEQSSYFKVALCYLKRNNWELLSSYEKKFFQEALFQESHRLLQAKEISPLVFEAIHLLEKSSSVPYVEKLADTLAKMITEEELTHTSTSMALCVTLKEEFLPTTFHTLLTEKYCSYFQKNLQERKITNPQELWQRFEALSSSIEPRFKQTIAQLISEEILKLLHEEKEPLKKTLTYLKFWKGIENSRERKQLFASTLFSYGIYYWKKENYENKGSCILKLALHLAEEEQKKNFSQDLETFFVALYNSARDSNMVNRLPLIYDAFDDFKLSFKRVVNEEEMANHLADADYLLSAQNYYAAKLHAQWVLKMEPMNETGLKLLGLASFHLGDFLGAKSALGKISLPDEEVSKALMLSEVFHTNEDEKTLVQLDIVHALECEEACE